MCFDLVEVCIRLWSSSECLVHDRIHFQVVRFRCSPPRTRGMAKRWSVWITWILIANKAITGRLKSVAWGPRQTCAILNQGAYISNIRKIKSESVTIFCCVSFGPTGSGFCNLSPVSAGALSRYSPGYRTTPTINPIGWNTIPAEDNFTLPVLSSSVVISKMQAPIRNTLNFRLKPG